MEETNNKVKEVVLPEFIKARLERIPWAELESQYGIKKEFVMSNEQIAKQLANGQVTDYVKCYGKRGDLMVIGPMALQANFRGDKVEVKHFTINPNPDLSLYGDALKSEKIAERLLDTYDVAIKNDEGKVVSKHKNYSFANGGAPVTLTRKATEGTDVKTKHLVSFDKYVFNNKGEIVRGTQRLFTTPCADVLNYLEKVAPVMYGHEFTPDQRQALSEGKDLYIEDFKTKDGKTFDAVVQYDAVSRQVVTVQTPFWRETLRKRAEANKTVAPAAKQEQSQKAEKTAATEQKASKGVRRS